MTRFLFILLFTALFLPPVSSEEGKPPKQHQRTQESYQKEIESLRQQADEFEMTARREPDAIRRNLAEQMTVKAREAADLREKEMNIRNPRMRAESAEAASVALAELNELKQKAEAKEEEHRLAKPTPPPASAPVPPTYETKSGFQVRLRMTD